MDNIANKQNIIQQMIFIRSILPCFAFTVVIQLLTRESKSKIVIWSVITFIASTMSLLIVNIGVAILLTSSNVLNLRLTPAIPNVPNELFLALLFHCSESRYTINSQGPFLIQYRG